MLSSEYASWTPVLVGRSWGSLARHRGREVAKVRAYELAHELNINTKALLALLHEMGEFVRSGASTIETPVERRLKERLAEMTDEERRQLPPPSTRPRPRELPRHLQVVDPSLPKDRIQPEDWDWPTSNRPPGQPPLGRDPLIAREVPGSRSPVDLDALMAERSEGDRSSGQQPRPGTTGSPRRRPSSRPSRSPKTPPKPDRWAEEFFEAKDKEAWLSAGVFEPILARACIAKGLRPADLSERMRVGGSRNGWPAASRSQ
jgi:hypothetical protein